MRITQTHIAEILFNDDEMLLFEDVVDILKIEFTYRNIQGFDVPPYDMLGVLVFVPSMGKRLDFRFSYEDLVKNYLDGEWEIRRNIVQLLELESWLNTPIDCSTEIIRYFTPEKFGIKTDTMNLDNRNN